MSNRSLSLPSFSLARHPKAQPIYATLRKRFCAEALRHMGFVRDGSGMVKRGPRRVELAVARPDGEFWRVTPQVRDWHKR
ncbi:hypothetical protein [Cupriavidus pampae]|uniref:Uncharacterized protein n=1 Tax=Cupriavidus pampae TaxID=659251 RepID=A0ABN7ZH07_9BURK|nr:hypothetical protein [Cupriavidus pampae]CAG9183966.1 hypothetical protein LMG32289_05474 [Cupriavidus pampae]